MDIVFIHCGKAVKLVAKIAAAGLVLLVAILVAIFVCISLFLRFSYSENSRLVISSHQVIQDEDKLWVFLETHVRKSRPPPASPNFSKFPHALHAFMIDESGVKTRITCPNDGSITLNANLSHLFAHNDDIYLLCKSTTHNLYRWTGKAFVPLDEEETRVVLEAVSASTRNLDDVTFEELDTLTSQSKWNVVGEGRLLWPELTALDGRIVLFGDNLKISVRSQNSQGADWEEVLLDTADIPDSSENQ